MKLFIGIFCLEVVRPIGIFLKYFIFQNHARIHSIHVCFEYFDVILFVYRVLAFLPQAHWYFPFDMIDGMKISIFFLFEQNKRYL